MSRGDVVVLLVEGGAAGETLETGDPVVIEIDLPANHAFGPKCMQCQTTIMRSSRSEIGRAPAGDADSQDEVQSREPGTEIPRRGRRNGRGIC
jgi:hypothetical protein